MLRLMIALPIALIAGSAAAAPPPPRIPFPTSLADARQRRHELERLPPDHRFLLALEELSQLQGQPRSKAAVSWVDSHWRVTMDDATLTELPETADFPVLDDLLAARARSLVRGSPPPAKSAPAATTLLFDDALRSEEEAINQAWSGAHSPALLSRAARAGVAELLQLFDDAGVADVVAARAWALHALALAAGAESDGDAALLAQVLGYTLSARTRAARLSERDPIRLFILHDDPALRALADSPSADRTTLYLRARRVAESEGAHEAEALALRVHPETSPAMAAALIRQGTLEVCGRWAAGVVRMELQSLAPGKELDESDLDGHVLETLESLLQSIPERDGAPFDAAFRRAASRARLYAGLVGRLEVDRIRGVKAERHATFAWMGTAPGLSSQVVRWLKTGFGEDDQDVNAGLWDGWPDLGANASLWVMTRRYSAANAGSALQREGLAMVLHRLDARPDHLGALATKLYAYGADGSAAVRFGERWLQAADSPWTDAWNRRWAGDEGAMQRLANDPSAAPWDRQQAVYRLLDDHALTEDEAARQLKALAEAVHDQHVSQEYAGWLLTHERWSELVSFMDAWGAEHGHDDTLQATFGQADYARALWKVGRTKEACEVMSRAVGVGSARVLYEDGLAQLAAGHRDRALQRAADLLAAYPDSSGAARFAAGIYWRAGEPQRAADVLKSPDWTAARMTNLAHTFAQSFDGATPEARAALEALLPVVDRRLLPDFAMGLTQRKAGALVSAVLEHVADVDSNEEIRAYQALKVAQGQDAALAWFAKRDHQKLAMVYAQSAFNFGADELLFVLPDPDKAPQAALTWMLRAFSVARRRITTGPEYERVRRHYSGELNEKADWSQPAGRFLLGLGPDPVETHPQTRPIALSGYAVIHAIRAEGQGDLIEAAECYLDSVSFLGVETSVDGSQANRRLREWYEAALPLGKAATGAQ